MVLDYEKYFTYVGSNMQGNDNYYTNDKSKYPDSVRFAGKDKYPKKVMVYVDISNRGLLSDAGGRCDRVGKAIVLVGDIRGRKL